MLICWWRKLTIILIKYMSMTSSSWRYKLKGFGNIWWDKVNRMYTSEGGGRIVYPQRVGRIR